MITRNCLRMVLAIGAIGLADAAWARLVPRRDSRDGVFKAELVVIVRQSEPGKFEITDHFLGKPGKGSVVEVPGFRLYTVQMHGPPMVEEITPDTRILMFLKRKGKKGNIWQVADFGYCFFWVHDPAGIDTLREKAKKAVALRKLWEKARDIKDPRKRVAALWPFLWKHGVACLHRTEAELAKTGFVAGDFIAKRFSGLSCGQKMTLLPELGRFGGNRLHKTLRTYLTGLRKEYEALLRSAPGLVIDDWNNLPARVKEIWGCMYYGMAGLAGFKDRKDLPYIRDLTLWAVNHRLKQTCDAALNAFRAMPAKENLPVIDIVWAEFSRKPYEGNEMSPFDVTRCLRTHRFPETVLRLTKLLDNPHAGQEARAFLKEIVGQDLGPKPGPWLKWFGAHQKSDTPTSKQIDFKVGEKTARPAKKKSAKITSTQPNAEAASQAELRKIKELAWRLGKMRRRTVPRSCDWDWDVNPLYLKLLKFGKRAVPVLLEVYKDGNPLAKRSVVCALGHMHDPDLRDFFLKATREKDPRLSIIAHWSLIYLKDRELIPFFLKNLQDPRNPQIRGYAASALAKFQDKSLIKPLRKALRIKDKARREIILALQELNATEAVGDLIEMYYDNPSFEFATSIVVCVGKLDGKRRVAFLIDCLKSRNPAVVIQALEALGQAGDKSCIPAVKRLLRSAPKKEVVLPVVGATLYRLGDKTGLQILDRGLGGKWGNRLAYAYELGRLRKKAATGVLLEKLLSKDEIRADLRRRILQALGDTGDKSLLPVLVSSLGKDHEGNYWAIKSIEKLTGLDFKCSWPDYATETKRKKVVEKVRAWWRQHKAQKDIP